MDFAATEGDPDPTGQTVTVTNAGGGDLSGLSVAISYVNGNGWLSVSLSSTTAPATLTVTPHTGSLPADTYMATVSVSSDITGTIPQAVEVTFSVSPPNQTPEIGLSPPSLSFSATQGGADPSAKYVSVTNVGTGTLNDLNVSSITYTNGSGWLTATLSATTAPATLTVQPHTDSLAAGIYGADISVAATAPNSPQIVGVTFTVAGGGNHDPSITSYSPTNLTPSLNEGSSLGFSVTATDPDGDSLSYQWTLDGSVVSTSSSYSYSPGYSDSGSHTVQVIVSDGHGGSASKTWNVSVTNVNRNPTIGTYSPSDLTPAVSEGSSLGFGVTATDIDGDSLSYQWTLDGSVVSTSSSYSHSPGYSDSGSHTVQVIVSDGHGGSASKTWNVSVIDVNRNPTISAYIPSDLTPSVNEGGSLGFAVTASDPDGHALGYQWTLDGSVVSTSGSFTYYPSYIDAGSPTVQVIVDDGHGGSASRTWSVTVIDVPRYIEDSGYAALTLAGKPFSSFTTVDAPSEYSGTTQFGQVDWLATSDTSLRGFIWFSLATLPPGCTVTEVRLIFNSFLVTTDASNYSDAVTVYSGPLSVTTTVWNGSTLAAKFGYGRSSTLPKAGISSSSHPGSNAYWLYEQTTRSDVAGMAGQFIAWRFDIGSPYLNLTNTAQGGDSWRAQVVVTLRVTYDAP